MYINDIIREHLQSENYKTRIIDIDTGIEEKDVRIPENCIVRLRNCTLEANLVLEGPSSTVCLIGCTLPDNFEIQCEDAQDTYIYLKDLAYENISVTKLEKSHLRILNLHGQSLEITEAEDCVIEMRFSKIKDTTISGNLLECFIDKVEFVDPETKVPGILTLVLNSSKAKIYDSLATVVLNSNGTVSVFYKGACSVSGTLYDSTLEVDSTALGLGSLELEDSVIRLISNEAKTSMMGITLRNSSIFAVDLKLNGFLLKDCKDSTISLLTTNLNITGSLGSFENCSVSIGGSTINAVSLGSFKNCRIDISDNDDINATSIEIEQSEVLLTNNKGTLVNLDCKESSIYIKNCLVTNATFDSSTVQAVDAEIASTKLKNSSGKFENCDLTLVDVDSSSSCVCVGGSGTVRCSSKTASLSSGNVVIASGSTVHEVSAKVNQATSLSIHREVGNSIREDYDTSGTGKLDIGPGIIKVEYDAGSGEVIIKTTNKVKIIAPFADIGENEYVRPVHDHSPCPLFGVVHLCPSKTIRISP